MGPNSHFALWFIRSFSVGMGHNLCVREVKDKGQLYMSENKSVKTRQAEEIAWRSRHDNK